VNEALRVYIDYHKEKKREQAEGVASIVRREWEATKQELADTSQAISDLQTANDLAGNERTPLQEKLDNVNRDLHEADKETEKLRAVWNEMTEAHADPARFRERGLYWRSKNPIGILEERQKSLENERESKEAERDRLLLGGLGREHERLAKLRGEIERLRAQEDTIAVQYAEEYLRSSEVEFRRQELLATNLAAEAKTLQAQVMQQSQVLERITDLKITRDQLRGRVAGFDERITQLELENQTGALNLDVIEYGRAGIRPVYPETEKTYIYALGGGGILAFGLVLLFGLSDRRVRDVEEVPRLLGTSVLGVLPELPHGSDRVRLARTVEEDPHSLASEAFRSVRTATTFGLPGGAGIVLVTSANANEGKSVCASNLAFALARAGKRTLLVDGDMRNPGQHENYSVPNGTGLAGLLNSDAPVKNALVPKVALGLDLLPAGDPHGKAAELCEGEVLGELLRSLRNDYECIVIDSPPVLETSEARILAALADAVVFVLRLEVSKAPNLKRAAGILRGVGARILGCLPNGASSRRGARAYAGGISIGHATPKTPTGPREARAAGDEGELGKARAHGTDFLGLKEESA
jgi:capsular exopolysaccharide synthesis family protein